MLLERGALLNNRYRIIDILGQGGMGSVYRAVDENLGVEVAVKDNLFTTEEYARQFRREAVILATLRHPNMPRVTDHFVIDGQGQYLIMDYIEGEDLRQRMDRIGTISEDEAIIIGAAICDALSYLATCDPPIVHRDIKPGNVRITPNGHIYLVDFGLAKDLKSHQTTTTGARAMTPGYSPPEQYGTSRTDQRSDIYSLGATLYAALTGMIPEDALSRAVDHVDLTPIRKHNGRVSRRLGSVIEKALDIRPDGRFQNPEEFKQALLSAASPTQRKLDEYIVAPPPTVDEKLLPGDHALVPPDVAVKLPRTSGQGEPLTPPGQGIKIPENTSTERPASQSFLGGRWFLVVLVFFLTALAIWLYTVNPAITNAALARIFGFSGVIPPITSSETPTITPVLTTGTSAPGLEPGASPTPTLSFTPTETLTPTPTMTLTPSLTPTPTATPTPTITPTPLPTMVGGGTGEIAFASNRKSSLPQVWIMNTEGKEARQITNMDKGACQPAWAPDGKQLIFISPCERNSESYPGAAMFLIPDVDAETIEVIPLPTLPGGDYDPAWSPDGTKIAFTTLRETGSPRVFVMDVDDKSVRAITELFIRSLQPSWSATSDSLAYSVEEGVSHIVIIRPDGKVEELLLQKPPEASDLHADWSPDGKTIVFTRYPIQGSPPFLMAVTLDNTGERKQFPVYTGPIPMREARYSPDGIWLAFESWAKGGNHEISVMTANGASQRNLTEDPQNDFDPAWRPLLK
jgi:eukaryotic-like serine/threonine-protein kinase